jgi:hypothetical protein
MLKVSELILNSLDLLCTSPRDSNQMFHTLCWKEFVVYVCWCFRFKVSVSRVVCRHWTCGGSCWQDLDHLPEPRVYQNAYITPSWLGLRCCPLVPQSRFPCCHKTCLCNRYSRLVTVLFSCCQSYSCKTNSDRFQSHSNIFKKKNLFVEQLNMNGFNITHVVTLKQTDL